MHPSLLPLPTDALSSEFNVSAATDDMSVFNVLRDALRCHLEAPDNPAARQELLNARRAASAAVGRLPRKQRDSLAVEEARALVKEMTTSGVHDYHLAPEDFAQLGPLAAKGWPGLLAAMLLAPAWQWKDAPLLLTVPEWLRTDYVGWLFAAPQGFCNSGDADAYAAHLLVRFEELLRWVNRSPGADAEVEVMTAFAATASAIPLYFSAGSLRRHAELRGQLLSRAFRLPNDVFEGLATPRDGRRLRVGFVNRHFGPQTETYTTLPTFEQLDPERFEVILFANRSSDTPLEDYCRKHASDFFILPDDLEGQLAMLRSAVLDIVVFGTNVTAVCNEVTRIALHRVAPLQVVNNSSCITSGLPEVDLYVSGTLTETIEAPMHFSERLGLLPGPAHAFNYYADREEPQISCSREEFGVPADAFLFVSAANYFKIVPEMQHVWARLLAAVPGSHLLVHPFNPNWTSEYPIARFKSEFEQVLANYGVEASRLSISTRCFPSRTDVKTLLGLGQVYLDTYPFAGVNSLVDPLELGMPVVTWEGQTFRSRMGAALLRQLELPELIAEDCAGYLAIAEKLATDPVRREACATSVREKMEGAPLFLDALAASEAFGDLIEKAYDELAEVGREAFRANRAPLRAADDVLPVTPDDSTDQLAHAREVLKRAPSDQGARHVVGKALLDAGRNERASAYLLGALQGAEAKADLWLDVARALRADGQMQSALQALEAGLKLDQMALEGWVMYAEMAHAIGSSDIAREAAQVAQQLAPEDTRVLAYL